MEYLSRHIYVYEPKHAPLERAMAAFLPYLEGMRSAGKSDLWDEDFALLPVSPKLDHTVFLMRLGVLPLFPLLCFTVFFWTRRCFGKPEAVLATALVSLTPTVLAHAGVATTDMGLAACLTAAFYALIRWAEFPTWKHALWLALFTALSVLSKFTAFGYLPAAAILAFVFYLAVHRPAPRLLLRLAGQRAATFALAAAVCALILWAGYFFSFGAPPGWHFRVPAPEMFAGIKAAMEHSSRGQPEYLLGERSMQGWWYFFPVALAVKTPLAILILLIPGFWCCWRRRKTGGLMPVAFFLGVLLPAMTSHLNIGVRHVLPVFAAFAVIAGAGVVQLAASRFVPALSTGAATCLLIWLAVSGARYHPDYVAYFNEIAGDHPQSFLVDSDLEWGQSWKMLAKRLRELNVQQVTLDITFNPFADEHYLRDYYGLPPLKIDRSKVPADGWNVVSPTEYGLTIGNLDIKPGGPNVIGALPLYQRVAPTDRVGPLFLYNIPPGTLR